jgi:Copper type II ascorbate-dependent monooxygenase, C-terminal domain
MGRLVRWVGAGAVAAVLTGCATAASPASTPAAAPAAKPTTSAATTAHGHAAPAEKAPPLRAGERVTTVSAERAYTPDPPGGGTDEYRCFLVDPGLRAPAFLTGSQFLPSNVGIVHHAILFRVPAADVAQARSLDAAGDGDGWTCFGGTGIAGSDPASALGEGSDWIAAWAPGGRGEEPTPAGTGYRLEPGAQLVMQVHYNLLNAGAGQSDRPGVRLRLMAGTAHLVPLRTTLLPAPIELPCPAGTTGALCNRTAAVFDVIRRFGTAAGATVAGLTLLCRPDGRPAPGSTQTCDHRVNQPGHVYALAGHMHLLGTKITVQLNPGRPGARTLLDVDPYNFHDQRSVALPKPVAVQARDTLRVTCTHDASLRPQVLPGVAPRYVVWGDGTTDEMCLGIVIRD